MNVSLVFCKAPAIQSIDLFPIAVLCLPVTDKPGMCFYPDLPNFAKREVGTDLSFLWESSSRDVLLSPQRPHVSNWTSHHDSVSPFSGTILFHLSPRPENPKPSRFIIVISLFLLSRQLLDFPIFLYFYQCLLWFTQYPAARSWCLVGSWHIKGEFKVLLNMAYWG